MEYIWSDSLSVGHEKIDGQHKQLFAAINDLIRVSQSGNTGDELKKSLDFLNDYTIKHFFEEEQLQLKFQYPDYENHKKLHEGLKQVLRELMHEWILKGSSKALAEGIKVKIGDWLVTHIKAEDTKLGAHIKSKS